MSLYHRALFTDTPVISFEISPSSRLQRLHNQGLIEDDHCLLHALVGDQATVGARSYVWPGPGSCANQQADAGSELARSGLDFDPADPARNYVARLEPLLQTSAAFCAVACPECGSYQMSQPVVEYLHRRSRALPIAHVTGVDKPPQQARQVVESLLQMGTRNFVALRGIPRKNTPVPENNMGDTPRLVRLIKRTAASFFARQERGNTGVSHGRRPVRQQVSVGVCAHPLALDRFFAPPSLRNPEPVVAPSTRWCEQQYYWQLERLAQKQQAGADFAFTQAIYEAPLYEQLCADAAQRGVTLPLVPSVVPLGDDKAVKLLSKVSGVRVPPHIWQACHIPHPLEGQTVSWQLTTAIVSQLLAGSAPGLHFLTFNRPWPAANLMNWLCEGVQEFTSAS